MDAILRPFACRFAQLIWAAVFFSLLSLVACDAADPGNPPPDDGDDQTDERVPVCNEDEVLVEVPAKGDNGRMYTEYFCDMVETDAGIAPDMGPAFDPCERMAQIVENHNPWICPTVNETTEFIFHTVAVGDVCYPFPEYPMQRPPEDFELHINGNDVWIVAYDTNQGFFPIGFYPKGQTNRPPPPATDNR